MALPGHMYRHFSTLSTQLAGSRHTSYEAITRYAPESNGSGVRAVWQKIE